MHTETEASDIQEALSQAARYRMIRALATEPDTPAVNAALDAMDKWGEDHSEAGMRPTEAQFDEVIRIGLAAYQAAL